MRNRIVELGRSLLSSHRFFVEKTPSFVGRWEYGWTHSDGREFGRWVIPWRAKLFYLIAYVRFMASMTKDLLGATRA